MGLGGFLFDRITNIFEDRKKSSDRKVWNQNFERPSAKWQSPCWQKAKTVSSSTFFPAIKRDRTSNTQGLLIHSR